MGRKYRSPMALHRNAVAYAATSLASCLMNSVFFFYYVKLFLDKYNVTESWFHFAQIVYMLWNAVNDPLFGYFQDNSNWSFCRSRKKAIYYGAPLWALTFLLPWFKWGDYENGPAWIPGIHLTITLCAYDALLTYVLLAQCALFAEISTKHEDRLQLVKYQQVASLIGSSSVFLSSVVSNNMTNMFNLQVYCVCIAFAAFLCMRYTGLNVHTKYESGDVISASNPVAEPMQNVDMSTAGAFTITKQIMSNKNFLSFVFMNFFQVFHVTFNSNFLLIFANHLIPKTALPPIAMSVLYGSSFILPQLMIFFGGNILLKLGAHRVIMTSFMIQIVMAICIYLSGVSSYWLLAAFFILDMSLPSAAFSLFNIPLSDIIDEDLKLHSRKHPQSSMVFGTNALITKPANSLAPMMVVSLLNSYGYERLKSYTEPGGDTQTDLSGLEELHSQMFQLICLVPIAVSVIQIIVWSFYGLRNSHTVESKYIES